MRKSEFIREDNNNLPPNAEPVMSRLLLIPSLQQYYEYYRFLIMVAGEPEKHHPQNGRLRDTPTALVYTPQEMDKINNALKRMGKKAITAAGPGSLDPYDTHTQSPVPHNSGKRKR